MDDNRLDRAIDEAARELTAGEPHGSFRARVLERIDEPRRIWSSPWVWSPLAAAALVAIAVVIRTPQRIEPTPLITSHSMSFAVAVRGLEPTLTHETPAAIASSGVAQGIRAARPSDSAVAALAPEPLAVPSIALSSIEPADSLRLEALEPITPIAVTPIGEPEGERR